VSTVPNYCKVGASVMDQVRVQVSVFGKTYAEVQQIAQAVRQALDEQGTGYRFASAAELYEKDAQVYHKALQFLINVQSTNFNS
jgi:hypothetical protein